MGERVSWPEYALRLAETARGRSEDPYVQVGAAILGKNNEVLATGYNGAPAGVVMDWSDRDERRKWVLHAESNALRYVVPGQALLLASTLMPCLECLKLVRSYGIHDVYYRDITLSSAYDIDDIRRIASKFDMRLIALE